MFNLIMTAEAGAWDGDIYEMDRSRFCEHTIKEIARSHCELNESTIQKLKSYPTLFTYEDFNKLPARVGKITEIKLRTNRIVFRFELEPTLPAIAFDAITNNKLKFDLGKFEENRSHWAIKDVDFFSTLLELNVVAQESIDAISFRDNNLTISKHSVNSNQIFIVHGHDEAAKISMARFISQLGFEPIILHEQPNAGKTIIEKIEDYSNVGFGVVLYTPCDYGCKVGAIESLYRARQNVVFEHGFLIGKLSRSRVSAFVKGNVETPNDISGMVYTQLDEFGGWKQKLIQELKAAGYKINNNLMLTG